MLCDTFPRQKWRNVTAATVLKFVLCVQCRGLQLSGRKKIAIYTKFPGQTTDTLGFNTFTKTFRCYRHEVLKLSLRFNSKENFSLSFFLF